MICSWLKNAARSVENSNMWKEAALFQGHSATWCLLLRSFDSCEEDMSEAKVHVSVEQLIIIKFLTKEGCKPSEIC
jgi:hypothetical protein